MIVTINRAVRKYQLRANWEYAPECRFFWKVYDLIRRRFKLNLPDCIFRCEPMNRKRSIRCISVNGFGGEHDITLNAKLLGMPKLEAFLLVAHGALHVWDECNGTSAECARHSAAFVRKAAELGIPAHAGRVCRVSDPASKILSLAARSFPDYQSPLRPGLEYPPAPPAKFIAYRCRCRTTVVPHELNISCNACGEPLVPVTDVEIKKYSCECETIRVLDEVDYVCLTCKQPMVLET